MAAAAIVMDFPAGVRTTGMMIFFGAATVRANGLASVAMVFNFGVGNLLLLVVVSANRAPEQAAESSNSRWVLLSDLVLAVLLLRLLATDDRLAVRRLPPPNMDAGLPPRIRRVPAWPLPLLVVLQPDSLSTPSSSGGALGCWMGRLPPRPAELAPTVVEVCECGLVPLWNWAPRAALSRLRSKPRPESLELSQLLTLVDEDEDDDPEVGGRC